MQGERKAHLQREVALDFDPEDPKASTEAVENAIVLDSLMGRLSVQEMLTLSALLEGYVQDLTDAELAERLKIAPSTFHSRKRRLLDLFNEELK
jgi:DNA-directed RNA polymerase specialized sigma24 family protein